MNPEGSFQIGVNQPEVYDEIYRQIAQRTVAATGATRLWRFVLWSLIFHCLHALDASLLFASYPDAVRWTSSQQRAKGNTHNKTRRRRLAPGGRTRTPAAPSIALSSAPLTPNQQQRLQQALLHAFDRGELAQMTKHRLGVDLDAVAGSGTLADVVFALVQWAERQGHTRRLVAEATAANPGNPFLQQFTRSLPG